MIDVDYIKYLINHQYVSIDGQIKNLRDSN